MLEMTRDSYLPLLLLPSMRHENFLAVRQLLIENFVQHFKCDTAADASASGLDLVSCHACETSCSMLDMKSSRGQEQAPVVCLDNRSFIALQDSKKLLHVLILSFNFKQTFCDRKGFRRAAVPALQHRRRRAPWIILRNIMNSTMSNMSELMNCCGYWAGPTQLANPEDFRR